MFTNATVLELYARARRDDDLREPRHRALRGSGRSLPSLVRRLLPGRFPVPSPVPVRSRQRVANGRGRTRACPRLKARQQLVERLDAGQAELIALYAARDGPVDAPTPEVVQSAATLVDLKDSIHARAPLMAAVIAVVMVVVLFLVFGSATLPLKAMVMSLLSLTASFGAMVWIFQDGRFEGLLRYESLGSVNATQPLLMFAIVFGLSMDYEVLLLSRVREEYLTTGDDSLAVARSLEKTGRLITSAALLVVVFLTFG